MVVIQADTPCLPPFSLREARNLTYFDPRLLPENATHEALVILAAALAATMALTLPDNFDPDLKMPYKVRSGKKLHASRDAASLARRLVESGADEDITLAVEVLDAVFACQETDESDPNHGNYRWYFEDEAVTDRNAGAFCLSSLIPMMLEHEDRLPEDTAARTRASIRLALGAVARIDVTLLYTNIAVKDFVNTILGGQLLDDADFLSRGNKKLLAWMQLTDSNGIPVEYNSPTYYRVTTRALAQLAELADDRDTRVRARTILARLGLSKSLRIHPDWNRLSGPHGRAYQETIDLRDAPERVHVTRWIDDGVFPAWLIHALDAQPDAFEIHETALAERQGVVSTRHTPAYAFGVATVEWPYQANVLLAHTSRPDADKPGVVYTRVLTNDKWLGDFYHSTDRVSSRNLIDEGRWLGVQNGGSAVGLYALAIPWTGRTPPPISSARTAVIWTGADAVEEIRVGDRVVADLPADVADDETVVITAGRTMTAVRVIARSRVGDDTPVTLARRGGNLVLDAAIYRGEEQSHEAINRAAGGLLTCALYFEIADRAEFDDSGAFAEHVASGTVTQADDAQTGARTVAYARADRSLGLEADLKRWSILRRWNDGSDLGTPMLESPVARQNRDGRVEVADAALTCGNAAGWLFAPPETGVYVAAYHGTEPAPLTLTVPDGKVEIDAMGTGTVVWDNGTVTVDAIGVAGTPRVTGGTLAKRAEPNR